MTGVAFDALPAQLPFPAQALGRRAELLLNGTWTDITPYLDHDPITIGRGHPDESTQVSQSTLGMTVSNTSGAFTSTNPASPFWPYLVRNVPCRVSVPEGAPYMRSEADTASGAQAPGAVGLSISGDMDVQADMTPDTGWLGSMWIASKWVSAGAQRSWALAVAAGGFLTFSWTTGGTTATLQQAVSAVPVTVPAGRRMCVRATFAQATGTVTFWTAPAGLTGASWTRLGAPVVLGSSTLYPSTAPVQAGIATGCTDFGGVAGYQGKYHALLILSGIGGTPAGSPDFTAQAPGTTSFADAQGNAWALQGTAEISARNYRGHFEVPGWPQKQDRSGKTVTVAASGGGLLRRLGQVGTPLQSSMRRAYTRLQPYAAPVAYWPMEDGSAADQLASALGGPPMYFTGSPQLSSSDAFDCSDALPVANGAVFSGRVPAAAWQANVMRFLMQIPSAGTEPANSVIASMYTTGTVARLDLTLVSGGALSLSGYYQGAQLFTTGPYAFGAAGALMRVSMELQVSGSSVTYSLATLTQGAPQALLVSGTAGVGSVLGAVTQVVLNPAGALQQTAFGHCSVQPAWDTLFDLGGALLAHAGEPAGTRFGRLCAEEGIQFRCLGNPAATTLMGPQSIEAVTQLLQECADADRGIWTELRQALGWGYVTRAALYGQPPSVTVSYAADHLTAHASDPTEDDQTILNDVTLASSDGSSVRYTAGPGQPVTGGRLAAAPPPAGIGTYDSSPTPTVNIAWDKDLDNLACWMLRMGTIDEPRFPGIALDLENAGLAGQLGAIAQMDLGDWMAITSPPPWLPPGTLAEMWQCTQESIADFEWAITVNAVPASPYQVAQAGVTHAATAGSQLALPYAYGAAVMSVATTAGNPWTTNPADFPFNIVVAGMELTVTGITGAASPQLFSVTPGVNGVQASPPAGAAVQVFPLPVAAL